MLVEKQIVEVLDSFHFFKAHISFHETTRHARWLLLTREVIVELSGLSEGKKDK